MTWNHVELANKCGSPQKQSDGSFMARCPAHEDKVQSLHITPTADGRTLARCHAGCSQEIVWKRILEVMGGGRAGNGTARRTSVSQPPPKPSAPVIVPAPEELNLSEIKHRDFGTPVKVYEYRDAKGALHFYNCRFEFQSETAEFKKHGKKTHRPYSCYGTATGHKWRFGAPEETQRIPYRLDKLKPTGAVMIHEGEKAADAGPELAPGVNHMAWWGGANNSTKTNWSAIAGRDVWLIPDVDKPRPHQPDGAGVAAMDQLERVLVGLGCQVKYCRNVRNGLAVMDVDPEDYKGFDAADAAELGWTPEMFVQYLDASVKSPEPDAEQCQTMEPLESAAKVFQKSLQAVNTQTGASRFLPLGYNSDTYYYLSRATKQIHKLTPTAHKRATLISICPQESFWELYVPMKKTGVDWDAAATRMMDECHKAGLFNSDDVRGRGAWFDNGHVVMHLGNRLIVDGETQDVLTRPGSYIYELAHTLEGPGAEPMTDEEASGLLDICRLFSWDHEIYAVYLVGWIALAPICGALDWRPHGWISGGPGTGKSTIENQFVKPLLGNMVLTVQGNSTEAGIRQMLGHDALPVVIDESEQEDDKSRGRGEAIIQMIRQASSEGSARTFKGGATGQATAYHIRSMFLLASIGVSIKRAADQARITKLTLYKNSNNWEHIKKQLQTINQETSRRLIRRTIDLIPVIRANAELLARKIKELTESQRVGDQYGTLLAGAVAMQHTRALTPEEADAIVQQYRDDLLHHVASVDHDETQCLDHLLQQIIRVDQESGTPKSMAVSEVINIVVRGHHTYKQRDAEDALGRYGLKVDMFEQVLKIARSHSQLAGLFRGTPWACGWTQFLIRIDSKRITEVRSISGKEAKVRFAGGSPCRAIQVPLDLVFSEDQAVSAIEDTTPF